MQKDVVKIKRAEENLLLFRIFAASCVLETDYRCRELRIPQARVVITAPTVESKMARADQTRKPNAIATPSNGTTTKSTKNQLMWKNKNIVMAIVAATMPFEKRSLFIKFPARKPRPFRGVGGIAGISSLLINLLPFSAT